MPIFSLKGQRSKQRMQKKPPENNPHLA